jgi:choice-of-anchor A domain-containing protein
MQSNSIFSALSSVALGIVLTAGTLQAGAIGAASGFGAFIFGNSTDSSDIATRIAIGGNSSSNVMSVGNSIQSGPTILTANPNVVAVVEGTGANGGVQIGSGQAGYNAGGFVHNGVAALGSDPFLAPANGGHSISSYKSFYEGLSGQLGALQSTIGTLMTTNQGLQLDSTGVSASTVVYNLSSTQWSNLGGLKFNANQTIIVNVEVAGSANGGTAYNLTANGNQVGVTGSGFGQVLFNFMGATGTLRLGNEGYGTLLAPDATITSGTDVNGQIIANTLNSIGELHDASAFRGSLPAGSIPSVISGPTGAPEPGSLFLLGGGLIALSLLGRRRAKARKDRLNNLRG